METVNRDEISRLQQIPNIGPSIAANLRLIGIHSPQDLLGKDPYAMYDELCETTGVRHDPCVIDVFIAAVRFMTGEPAKPWWKYTPERKQTLAENMLRNAVRQYLVHYHRERNHQGLDNRLIEPGDEVGRRDGEIQCRERLGGILRYYYRDAA